MTTSSTHLPAAPRVSIGLPVFNAQKFLPTALDALLAQTYDDFELIVSDNPPRAGDPTVSLQPRKND